MPVRKSYGFLAVWGSLSTWLFKKMPCYNENILNVIQILGKDYSFNKSYQYFDYTSY